MLNLICHFAHFIGSIVIYLEAHLPPCPFLISVLATLCTLGKYYNVDRSKYFKNSLIYEHHSELIVIQNTNIVSWQLLPVENNKMRISKLLFKQ